MKAIDAYWISAAEHGMNASTFTARVITSTGADVAAALSGAVGALSGPLHGGAPSRVLTMLDEVAESGDAVKWVKDAMDRKERLMGFGHRVYRAEDPRARVLRRTAKEIGAPRVEVAEALEEAALAELKERYPDRVLATNVEFWSAVVLDYADVPPELFTPLFSCARVGGWAAHILEQKREGRLIRPTALYTGPGPAVGRRSRLMEAATTKQDTPRSRGLLVREVAVPRRDPRGPRLPVPQARRVRAGADPRPGGVAARVGRELRRAQDRGGPLDRRRQHRRARASAA